MTIPIQKMTICFPDDWHVHLRDGLILNTVLPYTSAFNKRAVIMPNIIPPVTSINAALAYRKRILAALPRSHNFNPLMTCYLTDSLDSSEIESGYRNGIFTAAKLYPIYTTTNSSNGVTNIACITKILECMQNIGMPILVHCEIADSDVDIFDREARFIETVLEPIRKQFPGLKIVMEHISTKEAAEYVTAGDELLGATITPHHLMFNRNHMLVDGIRPHLYCLPILKSKIHQNSLRKLVASGNSRVFLGSDTAPHIRRFKEASCGCAGVFNAPTALFAYATIFEELNAMEHFETFCSKNGPKFYGLPVNKEKLILVRKSWKVENNLISNDSLVPFLVGKKLNWSILE